MEQTNLNTGAWIREPSHFTLETKPNGARYLKPAYADAESDLCGAVSDCIEWALPDLTLVSQDGADELRMMFDAPDPLERYR